MNETQQLAGIVQQQRKSSDGSDPFRTLSPSSSIGSSSSDAMASIQARPLRQQLSTSGCQEEDNSDVARPDSGCATLLDKNTTQGVVDDHRTLSPPIHLAPKGAGTAAAKAITDRGSAFFGSPTFHLFRTTSPFRRSLQEAMRVDRGQAPSQESAGSPVENSDTLVKAAYSESNYSSDTLIHKMETKQAFSTVQHPHTVDSREETSVFQDAATYRPTGERDVSTASSVGWKIWLSSDVAKLEQSPTRVSGQSPEIEYRIPTMPRSLGHGHVREAAQTGSCEEDEDNAKPPVRMPTSSTTPLSAIDSNIVKLSPQQRSVMRVTTPPAADLQIDEVHIPMKCNTLAPFNDNGASYNVSKAGQHESPLETRRSSRYNKAALQPHTPVRGHGVRQSKSLAGLKSTSRTRETQTSSPQPPVSSTIRLMRKSASKLALNSASVASSPAFTGAFERQFGSIGNHLSSQLAEKENQMPHDDDTQKQSPNNKFQFRGSKAMVDLFLSSRRRQGAGGDAAAFV
ncbi:hypothetical protein diail_6176 [Diaporthe ilicicola]|nr:hypothetical protein diail_6176 [Diaporthe ilicicola]